ncbi:unnamed protein product [Urochloa humidicola]
MDMEGKKFQMGNTDERNPPTGARNGGAKQEAKSTRPAGVPPPLLPSLLGHSQTAAAAQPVWSRSHPPRPNPSQIVRATPPTQSRPPPAPAPSHDAAPPDLADSTAGCARCPAEMI